MSRTKAALKYAVGLGDKPERERRGSRSRSLDDWLRRPMSRSAPPAPPPSRRSTGPTSPTTSERGDRSDSSDEERHSRETVRNVADDQAGASDNAGLTSSFVKRSPRTPVAASTSATAAVEAPVTVHRDSSDRGSMRSHDSDAYLTVEEWHADSAQRDKRRRFPKTYRKSNNENKSEVERELDSEGKRQRAQMRGTPDMFQESGSSDEEDYYGVPSSKTKHRHTERRHERKHYKTEKYSHTSPSYRSNSRESRHGDYRRSPSREDSREQWTERRRERRRQDSHDTYQQEQETRETSAARTRADDRPSKGKYKPHREYYCSGSDVEQRSGAERDRREDRGRQPYYDSGIDAYRRDESERRHRSDGNKREEHRPKRASRQVSYDGADDSETNRRGRDAYGRDNRRRHDKRSGKPDDQHRSNHDGSDVERSRYGDTRTRERRHDRKEEERGHNSRRKTRHRTPSPLPASSRKQGDDPAERRRRDSNSRRRSISSDREIVDRRERASSPTTRQGKTNNSEANIISFTHKLPEIAKWTNAPADKHTFTEFLDQFTMQARALMIAKANWSRILPLYLQDGSMIVYRKLMEKNPELADDYDALTNALMREFQACSNVVSAVDLYSKKKQPTESIGKFYSSICSMAKRLYPDMRDDSRDQIILGSFTQGLPANYQRHLLNSPSLKTSEDAFKLSQRLERTNDLLQKDTTTSAVNQITEASGNLRGEVETMQKSLKQLEARERERAEQEARQSRHQWREDNWSKPPIGPNRFRYNYQPASRSYRRDDRSSGDRNWRQTEDGRQRPAHNYMYNNGAGRDKYQQGREQNKIGYSNRYINRYNQQNIQYSMPARTDSGNQQYRNFSTSPSYQQTRPAQFQNYREQRYEQPIKYHNRFDRGRDYNNRHIGQDFATNGRPRCTECGKIGHLHYACSSRTDNSQWHTSQSATGEPQNRSVTFANTNREWSGPRWPSNEQQQQGSREDNFQRSGVYALYQSEPTGSGLANADSQAVIGESREELFISSGEEFEAEAFLNSYPTMETVLQTAEPVINLLQTHVTQPKDKVLENVIDSNMLDLSKLRDTEESEDDVNYDLQFLEINRIDLGTSTNKQCRPNRKPVLGHSQNKQTILPDEELKKKVNWIGKLKVVILIRILTAAVIAFHSPTASDKATNKSKEEMIGRPMIALENGGDTTPKIDVETHSTLSDG